MEPERFELLPLERRRVLDGNPMPLIREAKPNLEPGGHIIVEWSREQRHCDRTDGYVFKVPPKPVLWLTVTKITRRTKGGWAVRYDITDIREKAMYLAQKAGYTTDVLRAVDKGEVPLSEKDRARLATEAKAAQAERQERSREQRRRQERALKTRLRETLDSLSPEEQQVLLAAVERQIADAQQRREAA